MHNLEYYYDGGTYLSVKLSTDIDVNYREKITADILCKRDFKKYIFSHFSRTKRLYRLILSLIVA